MNKKPGAKANNSNASGMGLTCYAADADKREQFCSTIIDWIVALIKGRLKSVSDGLDVYPSDIFSLRKSIKLRTFALRKALST